MAQLAELVGFVRDHQVVFESLALLSVGLFVFTLVFFPLVVAQLPADYFVRHRREPAHQQRRHRVLWAALAVVKNVVGLVMIVAGIAMLVLPGQGLLTILIGLALTNFPGKYVLERRLFSRQAVHRALNRVRAISGKPPLEVPDEE